MSNEDILYAIETYADLFSIEKNSPKQNVENESPTKDRQESLIEIESIIREELRTKESDDLCYIIDRLQSRISYDIYENQKNFLEYADEKMLFANARAQRDFRAEKEHFEQACELHLKAETYSNKCMAYCAWISGVSQFLKTKTNSLTNDEKTTSSATLK